MHYHIYCNIKNCSKNYQDAIKEFTKRLSAYCDISLHTGTTLEFPKDCNANNHQFIRIVTGPSSYSSEEFAEYIQTLQQSGKSIVHIVVGFSKELFQSAIEEFIDCSCEQFSITNYNLPAKTVALLFYEQLYRGYTILQGKTYHK